MKAGKILRSGITGTSLMTLFSYTVSNLKKENFREPELLAELLENALQKNNLALPAGWSMHYSMGITWAALFEYLFDQTAIKRGLKSGLVLGTLSGLTGIVIWGAIFKFHPNRPRIDFKGFYGHLLLAHIVYSLSVAGTSRLIK
ncbi:MAG: hypothetical protein JWQ40_4263 [Segetibacter sp.]|jgi:hypothetical protein|nr:hypothetical protein [Segetibacter sp.]